MIGKLPDLILARLRSKGSRVVRLVDLVGLSEHADRRRKERQVDQTLQRLRRKGVIAFDSKTGWSEAKPRGNDWEACEGTPEAWRKAEDEEAGS